MAHSGKNSYAKKMTRIAKEKARCFLVEESFPSPPGPSGGEANGNTKLRHLSMRSFIIFTLKKSEDSGYYS